MNSANHPVVAFLVNGPPGSAMGIRARSFAGRLEADFEVRIAHRTSNRLAAIFQLLWFLLRTRPRACYILDIALAPVCAGTLYRAVSGCRLVIDTGDAIYELSKSAGNRGAAALWVTKQLERLAFSASDRIVVRSHRHQELLATRALAADVIPDGVDITQFDPRPVPELRRLHGLEGVTVIGLLGSLIWNSRWQMCYGWELVEVMEQLRGQPVKAVIIGDGDGLPRLREQCKAKGLEESVVFLGRIPYDELPRYLNLMDICLSTQTNDIPGQVRTTGKLPLYLACGRFVLASEVGEAARTLPPDMLVPYQGTKDTAYPQRLAERIRSLLAAPARLQDPQTPVRIARQHFDYDVLASRLRNTLLAVLGPAAGAPPQTSAASTETVIVDANTARALPSNGRPHRKMRVLHVGKFYPPHMGGIETHLQALCRELHKSVDLQVLVANDHRESIDEVLDGVNISRVATHLTLASTPFCPGLVEKIRSSQADIIHLHLPHPVAVLAYFASRSKAKVVVTYHSDTVRQKVLGPLFEPFLHALLRRTDAIIVSSPDYQRSSRVLARHADRCHIIPFGIALEEFENHDALAVRRLREQYGERVVLGVGRLVYYKGFEYLIRAMTRISGKLLLVGEGPLRPKLNQLVSDLGLEDKVVFVGRIPGSLVPYYHAADVFTLPSIARSEAFGLVQVEAMACGVPVVNTRLGSGVEFVSVHEQTGLTVPPEDAGALASAINHLLDDPERRRSLGRRARLRAEQEFSLPRMVERTLALYQSLMNGNL